MEAFKFGFELALGVLAASILFLALAGLAFWAWTSAQARRPPKP